MLKGTCVSLTITVILYSLILNISATEFKGTVPVLIWKDEKVPINSPAASTASIPLAILQTKYLSTFNPDNILLFLQDELSVEDLSSHEDVFKFIGDSMENHHSLYIPAVEATDSLVQNLSSDVYNVNTIEVGTGIGELKLEKDAKNLVVVILPPTVGTSNRRKAMQKTDEIVASVLSKVGKVAEFTVVFTGEEPPASLQAGIEHRRTSRSLQQSPPSGDVNMQTTDCVLLYLRSDMVFQKGNESYTLYNNNTLRPLEDCQPDVSSSIILKYGDLDGFQKLSVKFTFIALRRRWTLKDALVDVLVDNKNENKIILQPSWPMEDVPFNKSYTCSQRMVLLSNTTVSDTTYRLIIKGMQVEAFTLGRTAFSSGWDCVGFFTIPIWTGIFTSILFTFLLAVGMYMLSEVKTMDRFDDPKGKPIMASGGPSE